MFHSRRASPANRDSYGPFARPLKAISYERTRPCSRCGGSEHVACSSCSGLGRLPAGGYTSRNHVSAQRIVSSKWTAMERTLGWRHFLVGQKRKERKDTFVLMISACDQNTQLWVNIKNLKDRAAWASGWLQKTEIKSLEAGDRGPVCRTCRGSGTVACPLCSLAGEVVEL